MEDADEVKQKKRKLLYLESLRGIAAFVVVLSHFALAFYPVMESGHASPAHTPFDIWFYDNPLGIVVAGNFAVCLFFVMSAYVLVRPYFLSKRHDVIVSAAARRYFRLMPPAALSIAISYLILKFKLYTNMAAISLTGSQWLGSLFGITPHLHDALYQAFIGAFLNDQVTFNPLLWTMTNEFLGSMLIFGIAAVFGQLRKRWVIYAIFGFIFIRSYLMGFVIGMALADYMAAHDGKLVAPQLRVRTPFLVLATLLGLVLGAYPSDGSAGSSMYRYLSIPHFDVFSLMSFWHTIAAVLVVGSLLFWTSAQKFLSNRWFVQLGKMSFSIYLTHMILLCTVATGAFEVLRHHHIGYRLSTAITFVLFMVVVFGVGYLYTNFVDMRSIVWARKVGAWIMSKSPERNDKELAVSGTQAATASRGEA